MSFIGKIVINEKKAFLVKSNDILKLFFSKYLRKFYKGEKK